MRKIIFIQVLLFSKLVAFTQVTTFLWSSYNHAADTPFGAADYTFNLTCTSPLRTVPVSANITSSAGTGIFKNVVTPSTASPAYANNTNPMGTSQTCAPYGLVLAADWANVTSSITVTIYFDLSANGVTGPVKFSIDDINTQNSSFYDIVDISATGSAGVLTPVITSPIPSNNTAGGGGCSGSPWSYADCNGGATTASNVLTIPAAGNNGDCTDYANEFITVGTAADVISTITIKYYSGSSAQIGGGTTNPAQQYIVISALTTGGVCVVVLPVELLSFSGKCNGKKNAFNWTTITENNNAYFTLEKSKDGETFETVAKIKGNGNSIKELKYSYTYEEENANNKYYRLKQTDFNGKSKVLKLMYLNCIDALGNLNLYPNPATEEIKLEFESSEDANFTVNITDIIGRLLKSTQHTATQGLNQVLVNIQDLPAGSYYVSINSNIGSRPQILKFIKNTD
jgi:hypothetical protein